ncbi:Gamma-tubulin complex component [Aphis craccivora]|uniref:Gamma-tubulin complex component n=1 Tax=Aphis craccivora TaxID=307492 RepID=A0A6G0WED0_APHCR|nr:Gamma-tubulin complex component [Aphis craccivora]
MQTDTTILIRSSLEKQRVPRKAIRQRILFIENKIKQLNNNEITIKDYILNGVMNVLIFQ